MKRVVEGIDYTQRTAFLAPLDEFIAAVNPLCTMDVFVDTLVLAALSDIAR